jgi:hypothetical protein
MPITPQTTPQHRYPLTNPETGALLSEMQVKHLENLKKGADALYEAMHFAEGSAAAGDNEENTFMSRRMRLAQDHLETALLLAIKEVMW